METFNGAWLTEAWLVWEWHNERTCVSTLLCTWCVSTEGPGCCGPLLGDCFVTRASLPRGPSPRPLPLQTASIWLKPKAKQRKEISSEGGHFESQDSREEEELLAKSRYKSPSVHWSADN